MWIASVRSILVYTNAVWLESSVLTNMLNEECNVIVGTKMVIHQRRMHHILCENLSPNYHDNSNTNLLYSGLLFLSVFIWNGHWLKKTFMSNSVNGFQCWHCKRVNIASNTLLPMATFNCNSYKHIFYFMFVSKSMDRPSESTWWSHSLAIVHFTWIETGFCETNICNDLAMHKKLMKSSAN